MKFKERIYTNILLRHLPEQIAASIYVLYIFACFFLPEYMMYMFGNEIRKLKYKDALFAVIFIAVIAMTYRVLKVKMNTIFNDDRNGFYIMHSNFSEYAVKKYITVSELIWELPENYLIIASMLDIFLIDGNPLFARMFTSLVITLIISSICYMLLYKAYFTNNTNYKKVLDIFKYACLVISLIIGGILGDFVVNVPLKLNKGESEKIYNWIKSFDLKKGIYGIAFNKTMYISIVIIISLLIISSKLYQKNLYIKNDIYGLDRTENIITKLDFLSVILMGVLIGILIINGLTYNKVTVMIGYIVISNSLFLTSSNILEMNDRYLLDFEREKLLLWENDLSKLYEYKKRLFVRSENIPIMLIYSILYMSTVRHVKDIFLIFYFIFIIAILMNIAFIEKNYVIVENPLSIKKQYDSIKNNYSRQMDDSSSDLYVFFISIVLVVGAILYACGDIGIKYLVLIQTILTVIVVGFMVFREVFVLKKIKNNNFIKCFFD